MTLLAGFEILLYLHSGQEDALLITTIANRNHLQTEDLLGVLMNFLPLRVDLAGDPDGRTILRQVRDVTLEAYEHQDLPFARMLQELPPDRRTLEGLSPVGFVLQNAPTSGVDLPGLGIRSLEVWNGTAKRDLIVILADDGRTMIASAMYRSSVYDREAIRRVLAHYENVLEDLVADPGRRLSGFRLR
jgi:aspartate racemase